MDAIYLAAFNLFQWIVRHTPDAVKFPIIKGLAKLAYWLDAKHRRVARVNLDLAFGDSMSGEEKQRIIKKCYENMLFNLADFVQNQGISKDALLSKVRFENEEILENAKKSGRPIIFMTAHYGNWEILPLATAVKFDLPISVVGRPLDSKTMNTILERNRQQFDVELIPKKGAMKPLIKALKEGRAAGLLVDQNTTRNEGILVDLFGKKARHTMAVALLARRLDAIIIPTFITSEDHKTFTVTFYPPLEVEKTVDKDEDMRRNIQAQSDAIEQAIRNKQDEWFWLHRRWKDQYGELYENS
jgi:KDO2-lipid IV(A) lauroyltransferase